MKSQFSNAGHRTTYLELHVKCAHACVCERWTDSIWLMLCFVLIDIIGLLEKTAVAQKVLVLSWLPLCCSARGVKVTQTGTNLCKVVAFVCLFVFG